MLDHVLIIGLDDGWIQVYEQSPSCLEHKQDFKIYEDHIIMTDIILKKTHRYYQYNLYISGKLNRSKIENWNLVYEKTRYDTDEKNFFVDKYNMFLHIQVEKK